MTKTFYAVFDTNVLVSALMTRRADSPTVAGNLKHFPTNPIVVTPAKMIQIMTEGQ